MKSRSNRYLRAMSRLTCSSSVDGRISARAVVGSLRSRPRAEHAAMLTNGFRRIRLTLPDPSAVMTKSRSPSVANHTGVATPEPLRRKLVMLRYLPGIRSTSAGAGARLERARAPSRGCEQTSCSPPDRPELPTGHPSSSASTAAATWVGRPGSDRPSGSGRTLGSRNRPPNVPRLAGRGAVPRFGAIHCPRLLPGRARADSS